MNEELARQLQVHVGHYMAAVAEQLLDEGIPIVSLHAYAPKASSAYFDDAEGALGFGISFQRNTYASEGHALYWTADSGWCFHLAPVTGPPLICDPTRWLSDGLVPTPWRVATFVFAVQLDFPSTGSEERPFYRVRSSDIPALIDRLAQYVPSPQDSRPHPSYHHRFGRLHAQAYHNRVLRALLSQVEDRVLDLPLRASELKAVLELLEFAEATSRPHGPNNLAARAGGDYRSLQQYRTALDHAMIVQENIDDATGDAATPPQPALSQRQSGEPRRGCRTLSVLMGLIPVNRTNPVHAMPLGHRRGGGGCGAAE
ncbi:hypothetical protein ACFYXH_42260 [Streptomyces sp. NPDC002730]|uniref:hypothetical protein n=1 Tax=Streptomyces sp. NPDC002730 TaxID=3364662 RepID=UPI003694775F